MKRWTCLAPAKVNLTLQVGAARADGRHPLDSLVAFADIGDRLSLEHAPGGPADVSVAVEGPFAADLIAALSGAPSSVEAAARLLLHHLGVGGQWRFALTKALPIASGVGGGSADAGAAMRLIAAALALDWSAPRLAAFAQPLGGDMPACVLSRPCRMLGDGDRVEPLRPPTIPIVLVNPNVPCPTGAVYRTFDQMGLGAGFAERAPAPMKDLDALLAVMEAAPNSLEAPARRVAPAIDAVLTSLRAQPLAVLARVSGSGATCFAITRTDADARALAGRLRADRPEWWVTDAVLQADEALALPAQRRPD